MAGRLDLKVSEQPGDEARGRPVGFDAARDSEGLLREVKPGYSNRPPRPRLSPLSEHLAEFAKCR
ncbi:hypothetical protein FB565_001642 [Actinoplanes lutulentus]|uniref:hypothetical protein n=1 Tax=Actinoplanes lutulentus TaxID=1287878 RepID=UPI000DB9173B|nr:hypothetical protein [Actinoplanes lutulentus]MBB2941938.1 hypothetical protein [Actinoplanes lutulentus]